MNLITLSICMPTKNNAAEIEKNLNAIFEQATMHNLLGYLQVVISDNASSDHTEEICRRLATTYANVSYVRNQFDVGPSQNLLSALTRCTGDYIWLMGDDLVVEGGLLTVFHSISSKVNRPSVVYTNWTAVFPNEYTGNRANQIKHLNNRVKENLITSSREEFISLRGGYLPFISALILQRELIDYSLLERKLHSRWFQLYAIFSCLRKNPITLHISDVIVVDDIASKSERSVKRDPWPSNIYSGDLVGVVNDLVATEMISLNSGKLLLDQMACFIFCDYCSPRLAVRDLIGVSRVLDNGIIHCELASGYIIAIRRAFFTHYTRVEEFYFYLIYCLYLIPPLLLANSVRFKLIRSIRGLVKFSYFALQSIFYRISPSASEKLDVLIVSPTLNSRSLKLCYSLQQCSLQTRIFDIAANTLIDPSKCDGDFSGRSKLKRFALPSLVSRSKKVLYVCVWDYRFVVFLLVIGFRHIYIDPYDILNGFLTKSAKRKYIFNCVLERYALANCSGIVCRDLRTNLLRKQGFKLAPRILYMDYMLKPDFSERVVHRSLVYVGNLEVEVSKSESFQYELARVAEFSNFKFSMFPSYAFVGVELKDRLLREFSFLGGLRNTYVFDTRSYTDLLSALGAFSFGLLISSKGTRFEGHSSYENIMSQYFFAGKVFDYCEAGVIPIVQKGAFVCFMLRRLGMGYSVDTLTDIPHIINDVAGTSFCINPNRRLTLDANSHRLCAFLCGAN